MVDLGADWLHVDVMVRCATAFPLLPSRCCRRAAVSIPLSACSALSAAQDGHFVPNLTLGAPIVKSLRKHTAAFLDVHLMVTQPAQVGAGCGRWGAGRALWLPGRERVFMHPRRRI